MRVREPSPRQPMASPQFTHFGEVLSAAQPLILGATRSAVNGETDDNDLDRVAKPQWAWHDGRP